LRSEREFWHFLREVAVERRMTVTALIEAIDQVKSVRATLVSAIRVFVAMHYRGPD
jgi:predicted DNA-binding ribbon-helix-helix protein